MKKNDMVSWWMHTNMVTPTYNNVETDTNLLCFVYIDATLAGHVYLDLI